MAIRVNEVNPEAFRIPGMPTGNGFLVRSDQWEGLQQQTLYYVLSSSPSSRHHHFLPPSEARSDEHDNQYHRPFNHLNNVYVELDIFSTTSTSPPTMSSTSSLLPSTTTTSIASIPSQTEITRSGSPIATTSETSSTTYLTAVVTFTTNMPSSLATSYSGSSDVSCTALVAGVTTAISVLPTLILGIVFLYKPAHKRCIDFMETIKHLKRKGKGARTIGLLNYEFEIQIINGYRHVLNTSAMVPRSMLLPSSLGISTLLHSFVSPRGLRQYISAVDQVVPRWDIVSVTTPQCRWTSPDEFLSVCTSVHRFLMMFSIVTEKSSSGSMSSKASDTSSSSTSLSSTSYSMSLTPIIATSSTGAISTFSTTYAPPSTSPPTLTVTSTSSLLPSTTMIFVRSTTSQNDTTTASDESNKTSLATIFTSISISPILDPPRLLRPIPYIPESLINLPKQSLEVFQGIWRDACRPLYHCRCKICERAKAAEGVVQIAPEDAAQLVTAAAENRLPSSEVNEAEADDEELDYDSYYDEESYSEEDEEAWSPSADRKSPEVPDLPVRKRSLDDVAEPVRSGTPPKELKIDVEVDTPELRLKKRNSEELEVVEDSAGQKTVQN
ncbi:hypothetical protein EDD18DRAFT_1358830 [Armillaria luteobubalina]|uniref:Uncharacterized protein n=1 Tax=Armillaria luteobubalina TaxID=153913 RepID=A0AA39PU41_9AGAR|nr:hypothetical protein EDD18DRAFT_1358830 [Armillaria luteobubalina]